MIKEALLFATKAHEGVMRKGTTNIPYITHPVETAVIVSLMTDEEEMIAAALLHDVMEDAGVTWEELERLFGKRVADLVLAESEDKSGSWQERKGTTIEHLQDADRDIKILTLGDKLSNMRSTAKDYLVMGDQIWQKFNEKDKAKHAWYYGRVAAALKELEGSPCYQEYLLLYNQVFGDKKGK
ncbi:MAG: HD domain-containing protein [Hungatella sp.]